MNVDLTHVVVKSPHISEKANILAEKIKTFTFKVEKNALKPQIKSFIESYFGVKVAAVNTVSYRGKKKIFRQKLGKRSDWKKAYVTLAPGYDLDFAVSE